MKNVSLVSRPIASTWRASDYQLALHGFGEPQDVRAHPKASWEPMDVFDLFRPGNLAGERGPHVAFLGLKSDVGLKGGGLRDGVFVRRYGLLGLFEETFAAPVLPDVAGPFAWVAPDTVLDKWGRLQPVDPATEGKELLAAYLSTRLDTVVLPHELSFPSQRFTPFGLLDPEAGAGAAHSTTFSWEEVRELYGVRAVLDQRVPSGVSILSTHEPLNFWVQQIKNFPIPPCGADVLNSRIRGVSPYAVENKVTGKSIRQSWRCFSLLQAMHLMLYLDETGDDVEIKKCQAPNCPDYFRVTGDGRSRKRIYCPHPTDPKKQGCASRASSGMHRDRQRGKS